MGESSTIDRLRRAFSLQFLHGLARLGLVSGQARPERHRALGNRQLRSLRVVSRRLRAARASRPDPVLRRKLEHLEN